ncbi:MAG: tetratricopeptide repeat protein [Parcubacteria group bacterium]|nr:tetratricopeptide repeat protein [Parcubacteria group bacterium]
MSTKSLQKLYDEGFFKPGHSEAVDECITNIVLLNTDQVFRTGVPRRIPRPALPAEEFTFHWSRFVGAVTANFPNIEPYNLTAITTLMVAEKRHQEELFLCQLIEALCPSCESMCFLGHAYWHLEDRYLALQCYQEAHRRSERFCKERKLGPDNPNWLDAGDYLRYAAECQLALDMPGDALTSLVRCVQIFKAAGKYGTFKREDLTRIHRSVMEAAGWNAVGDLWEVPTEAPTGA